MTPFLEITGKDISESQRREILSVVQKIESKNLMTMEAERPKSEMEIAFIDHAIVYVREYLRQLELSDDFQLTREHFHMMSEGGYVKKFHSLSEGLYDDQTFSIYIDYFEIFAIDPLFLFEVILHEAIHAVAFHRIEITEYDTEYASVKMRTVQSGYNLFDFKGREAAVSFYGFNEMIDDAIVAEILATHEKEIKSLVPSDSTDKFRKTESHPFVKNVIVQKIADATQRPFEEKWKVFARGYFTGHLEALELVKKYFGEQAWHLLAIFRDNTDFAQDDVCYPALQNFFTSEDATEKESALKFIESRCRG